MATLGNPPAPFAFNSIFTRLASASHEFETNSAITFEGLF